MKNIILKKVIPIICVISILISCVCISASAESNYNHVLSPTTMFSRFRSAETGVVQSFSDSSINFTTNGVNFFYTSRDERSQPFDKFSIMTNLGSGFIFKKGIPYTIKFKFVIPKSYAPGESLKHIWHSDLYNIGFYSWASPNFDAKPDIMNLKAPQFDIYGGIGWIDWNVDLDDFYVPPSNISYDMVAIDMVGSFVPVRDVTAKAFGITWDVKGVVWYGQVGLGDFYISMPIEYKPIDVPNFNSDNTNAMHNAEQQINSANSNNINSANSLFSGFSSLFQSGSDLLDGLTSASAIITSMANVNWIQSLISLSLTLGLVAFLLGSGVSIFNMGVNRGYRRERRQERDKKTEAYRQARLKQRK